MIKTNKITHLLPLFCTINLNIVSWTCLCYFPSFIRVWFFWESRLQHKFTWWLLKFLKFFENFEILWKFWFFFYIFEILKKKLDFRVFVNRRWSPSIPSKHKTFIQSGLGTKNPRKRFTLPVHSLNNYGPLNSETTGKGEQ